MIWICQCGKEATRLEVLWQWREGADIGQKVGRFVSYRCRIGCDEHLTSEADARNRLQYFQVKLTAHTKQALVGQILAQVLRAGPRGYLPKTDLAKAVRSLRCRD